MTTEICFGGFKLCIKQKTLIEIREKKSMRPMKFPRIFFPATRLWQELFA